MKLKNIFIFLAISVLTACGAHQNVSSSTSSEDIFSSSFDNSSTNSSDESSSTSTSSYRPSFNEDTAIHAYDDYYVSLGNWENGEELKNKLYELSRQTYHPLTYVTPNYETNINADHSYYDFEYLDVVYSGTDVYKGDTNKGWQREHAFCASLMCGSLTANAVKMKGRATDFHNLFAADASANSSRGNKNYGTANKTSGTNRTTNNGKDGYSFDKDNFEPADKDKGRLARAIFYMAMMYKDPEVDTINGITMGGLTIVEDPVTYVQGENGAFAIGNLSTLLEWNKKYPVDYLEMQHNISVYKDVYTADGYAQGNRNPFVDYPSLVDCVFGQSKNAPSGLYAQVPSEYLLECESWNKVHSHYALKEAKRSYSPGKQIANNDYKVVEVFSNYEYEVVNEGFTNSLKDHTFSEADGEAITATITAGKDTFSYSITLDPLASSSSGEIVINANGINKSKNGQDQEIKYGDIDFILNCQNNSSSSMYIQNINNQESIPIGVTLGSGNNQVTKFVLKTKSSYKINAAYIKVCVGNVNSSYKLTIKVGDSVLLNETTVNNKDVAKIFGTSINSPLQGQLSYIFEGSSSLKINSVAFNTII